MRMYGSQVRETLQEGDYTLVALPDCGEAILRDAVSGVLELWVQNDDFAGYVIEIDGRGYEFVSGYDGPAPRSQDDLSLAEVAEMWALERGERRPRRGTRAWNEMYERWWNAAYMNIGSLSALP